MFRPQHPDGESHHDADRDFNESVQCDGPPSSDSTILAILLEYSLSNEGVQITSSEVLENPTDAASLPDNGQLQSHKSKDYFMSMKMKAAQISKPGGEWELVERDIPEPGAGQVRVKLEACGICHSDVLVKEGLWPGLQYPRVPGHEIAGRIDAIGGNVTQWTKGQRVGVGWHGGHDFVCEQCRRGDFAMCVNRKVTGIDFDGGYAEYMIAPATALAAIPDELPAEEAGPFMCAGVTVFNALRNSGAHPGDVVAVQGIGGLGHLGIQYARKMGFETVALGRGKDKEPLAKKLGAHHYIDSGAGDAAAELQKLGGARVILATAPNAKAISALVDVLSVRG